MTHGVVAVFIIRPYVEEILAEQRHGENRSEEDDDFAEVGLGEVHRNREKIHHAVRENTTEVTMAKG